MIHWEIEKFGRYNFDPYIPFKPLREEFWMPATGIWLFYWGVGVVGHDVDLTGDICSMTPGHITENTNEQYIEIDGRSEYDGTLPFTHGTYDRYNNGIQAGARYYDLPDTGAVYPYLALLLNPFTSDEEVVPDPVWGAAEVRYKLEG